MMAIITQIRELDRRMRFGMGYHPVQGYPSIAVTDVAGAHGFAQRGARSVHDLSSTAASRRTSRATR